MRNKPQAVIIDVDGTLADVSGIRHFVRPTADRPWKDFESFHAASVDVPANERVVHFAQASAEKGLAVLIVTARRARWRHQTAWWLALNEVPSSALFMRGDRDSRPDVEVKRDILARIRQSWDPIAAVDDNPSIIALWESEGIFTLRVPGWEE